MKIINFIIGFIFNLFKLISSGRVVGNVIKQNTYGDILFQNPLFYVNNERLYDDQQFIINNKNNLIYGQKDRELFLEENNFIKDKKLISISPGGLKGFYELGILSYIKDNYNMDKYIFSGASAGSWNALFMCYNKDTKKFVYNMLDYKLSSIKSMKALQYFLKYKLLSNYNTNDFDLRRLFIGVTTIKNLKKETKIFSDFDNLEDAINCCIASSHIPLITGGLTNRYHDMLTFDGGFSNYPYLNFTENVLHITPDMWKEKNKKIPLKKLLKPFSYFNVVFELFEMNKNLNYMEMFDHGYQDAKTNKKILDKIFVDLDNEIDNLQLEITKDNDSY